MNRGSSIEEDRETVREAERALEKAEQDLKHAAMARHHRGSYPFAPPLDVAADRYVKAFDATLRAVNSFGQAHPDAHL